MTIRCKCGNLILITKSIVNKIICPKCSKKVEITQENITSITRGDFQRLGIFYTFSCERCNHIVEPLPVKEEVTSIKYEKFACPICRKSNTLFGKVIPDYLGGYNDIGLSGNEKVAKSFYYFIKSLLDYCIDNIKYFNSDNCLLIDNLINVLICKALDKNGEISLKNVQKNWEEIAKSFNKLRTKAEEIGFINTTMIEETRKEWDDLICSISNIKEETFMGIFKKSFLKKESNSVSQKMHKSDDTQLNKDQKSLLLYITNEIKKTPEIEKCIKDFIKSFGDNPLPNIIETVISSAGDHEIHAYCAASLCYIGTQAIPYLINLLGHEQFEIAKFAADTLPAIKGSLPYLINALKSSNSSVRLHAAGALQGFGTESENAIPQLCEIIEKEENLEIVDIAATALAKIGQKAIPALRQLLKNKNSHIRLAGVAGFFKIGSNNILPILQEAKDTEEDFTVVSAIDYAIKKISEEKI